MSLKPEYPTWWIIFKLFDLRDDTLAQGAFRDLYQANFRLYFGIFTYRCGINPVPVAYLLGVLISVYFLYSSIILYFGFELSVYWILQLLEILACGALSALLLAALFCQKQYILAGTSVFLSIFSWMQFVKMLVAVGIALYPLSTISGYLLGTETIAKLGKSPGFLIEMTHIWTTRIVLYYLYFKFLQWTSSATAKSALLIVFKKATNAETTYTTLC